MAVTTRMPAAKRRISADGKSQVGLRSAAACAALAVVPDAVAADWLTKPSPRVKPTPAVHLFRFALVGDLESLTPHYNSRLSLVIEYLQSLLCRTAQEPHRPPPIRGGERGLAVMPDLRSGRYRLVDATS
ncbi:MAG: hypothetical protein KGL43_17170 [Burkholderiales bacterium]|nr:hypothetical protein [Burkholderiales bacterium]MDE2455320.1 hypothetical protein [Burkholderiales bacterium]